MAIRPPATRRELEETSGTLNVTVARKNRIFIGYGKLGTF
jgi:hypothetical protein